MWLKLTDRSSGEPKLVNMARVAYAEAISPAPNTEPGTNLIVEDSSGGYAGKPLQLRLVIQVKEDLEKLAQEIARRQNMRLS